MMYISVVSGVHTKLENCVATIYEDKGKWCAKKLLIKRVEELGC
jgi:hypothetical protein